MGTNKGASWVEFIRGVASSGVASSGVASSGVASSGEEQREAKQMSYGKYKGKKPTLYLDQ